MNSNEIEEKPLTSTKPYLLRAFYDWIVDNECDPYIIVNTDISGVVVPTDYIHDGKIVLNIAMRAINHLKISNDYISFDARFSGVLKEIFVPLEAVLAIYANENGRGMVFSNIESSVHSGSEFPIQNQPEASHTFNEVDKSKLAEFKKPVSKGKISHLRLVT
jgi:stringent starvation protein B